MINFDDLVLGFENLGLKKNDLVLIHSSFKSFGGVEGGPQTVIDALTEIVGKNGTLLFPTFNFDFSSEGSTFDVKKTPSQMGILTEFARKNPNSKRTIDPIYSFVVLGELKDELGNLVYENSYGPNSMFAKLREKKGKIMVIGLKYNDSVTFFHHVEEIQKVDYRFPKEFHGEIIDYDNERKKGKITLYVRNLEMGTLTDVDKMGVILENENIVKVQKIGNSLVKLMDAKEVYARTVQEMKKNPHILCNFKKSKH